MLHYHKHDTARGKRDQSVATLGSWYHPVMVLLISLLAFPLLTACNAASATSSDVHATQTMQAQATKSAQATVTAQPVTMTATAQAQGTVASHHLKITITFTLTNHTNFPMHMYRVCGDADPPLAGLLSTTNGQGTLGIGGGGPCTLGEPPADYPPAIAPGTAQTWVFTEDDSALTNPATANGLLIQMGVYTGTVTVKWHEGDLTLVNGTPGHIADKVSAWTTVTVQ